MGKKCVVLLSGGLDSATCLAVALDKFGKGNVYTLNMYYGQRHEREIKSAQAVADHYGVPYQELDLSAVISFSDCSLLKKSSKKIKHQTYEEQIKEAGGNPVETYVPFRNGLFLSAAASYAISIGADCVMYGAHADDAAGSAYPDCSKDFADAIGEAIYLGSGKKVMLEAPFIEKHKSDIVGIGLSLNTPYELTWSCYEGGEKPCGKCGTCIDRAAAFAKNGIKDPALN